MPFWTFFGLQKGKASTAWPKRDQSAGQDGVLGMPRFEPEQCDPSCQECAQVCPTGAITVESHSNGQHRLEVDYGRCVACQLCVETCPTQAVKASFDWAFGVRDRADLLSSADPDQAVDQWRNPLESRVPFHRSLHIRHVDAGSCNGCESELQALNNPFYNLHRLGIFFTPSPRFADLLLVTGPVTYAMREPLKRAYEAMPGPRWVMAVGTCAVSGGVASGGYACGNGLEGVLPVDVYLPGCPPNPAAMIQAFLMFLDRMPQQVQRGRVVE
ncbi:NADH-quinone oxidoreductase subunit NuoB [Rhodopila sp.]|jgi:Ni,Fe-hydrogenase III small subunit/ferredoxin|uniref:NADH-quinone oxidoreductase subunit NuoB n=1 Tax=Rhodopila sp. TaxID=2480087 RepID=UPI002BDCB64D|nr:NADH-quinone oxidoreductase subunit NuoB [Rhodopila sp.]HVZ06743.1 NADH-quinone oxidoreductase subunit NuoB [Rhodopila sp.]